jgi:hypothetical protein
MWPALSSVYSAVRSKPELLALTVPGVIAGIGAQSMAQAQQGVNTLTGGGNGMAVPLAAATGRGIIDIPGIDINWAGILPGGDPFIVNEGPNASWVYSHTANGQVFYRAGNYFGTYNKGGAFKYWRVYRPIVFGKRDDPRKLARIIKRHHGAWKELNKVFGKRVHHEFPKRK